MHWGDRPFRVAAVSDTHGFLDPRIIELVQTCSIAVHAGDIGSATVLDSLMLESRNVFAVAGNNDTKEKWKPSEWSILKSLPECHEIRLPGGIISVEHGHRIRNCSRYHEELRSRHPESRVVIYGHSHRRVVDSTLQPWVVNPGASGRNRTFGGPSCLILETTGGDWNIAEYSYPLYSESGV